MLSPTGRLEHDERSLGRPLTRRDDGERPKTVGAKSVAILARARSSIERHSLMTLHGDIAVP